MSKEHKHQDRYGKWSGNPNGIEADLTRCAESVFDNQTFLMHQCSRKNGHGPNGIYCKQHAKRWIKGE